MDLEMVTSEVMIIEIIYPICAIRKLDNPRIKKELSLASNIRNASPNHDRMSAA
jgi:hypothetical protein